MDSERYDDAQANLELKAACVDADTSCGSSEQEIVAAEDQPHHGRGKAKGRWADANSSCAPSDEDIGEFEDPPSMTQSIPSGVEKSTAQVSNWIGTAADNLDPSDERKRVSTENPLQLIDIFPKGMRWADADASDWPSEQDAWWPGNHAEMSTKKASMGKSLPYAEAVKSRGPVAPSCTTEARAQVGDMNQKRIQKAGTKMGESHADAGNGNRSAEQYYSGRSWHEYGARKTSSAEESMSNMCGTWHDDNGGKYVLTRAADNTIDVTTTYQSGAVRSTRGLIRIDGNYVVWGRNWKSQYWLKRVNGTDLVWERSDGSKYHWQRRETPDEAAWKEGWVSSWRRKDNSETSPHWPSSSRQRSYTTTTSSSHRESVSTPSSGQLAHDAPSFHCGQEYAPRKAPNERSSFKIETWSEIAVAQQLLWDLCGHLWTALEFERADAGSPKSREPTQRPRGRLGPKPVRPCNGDMVVIIRRPTGEEEWTSGLVRLAYSYNYMKAKVVWGETGSVYSIAEFDGLFALWQRPGGRSFHWERTD